MGSWGTAIYSNDTSSDVRDMCNEVYPLVGVEKGTELILEEYAEIINGDVDNDYADFWYALADWQWKHGILSDDVKNKTIALLEAHTGIEEWMESGTAADVRKRLAVMDKLLTQLKSSQPDIKIPKPKIAKPKHKPGDIIVVRTCTKENDPENWIWNIERCTYSYIYKPEIASKVSEVLDPPYDAHDKYIAILCVGTEKMPHSQYVDGIFDEYSVYAFYDYVSSEKPTVEQLMQCGFLPKYLRYSTINGPGIQVIGWTYTFDLITYSFRISKDSYEQSIERLFCEDESKRFHYLFSRKDYLSEASFDFELHEAFAHFFEEKARLTVAGIKYDDLLDPNGKNPPLCSLKEVSKMIKDEIEEMRT